MIGSVGRVMELHCVVLLAVACRPRWGLLVPTEGLARDVSILSTFFMGCGIR